MSINKEFKPKIVAFCCTGVLMQVQTWRVVAVLHTLQMLKL